MKKITPFLWFDGKAEEAMNDMFQYLKIQKSCALPDMEKKGRDRRVR